jgi:thiamine pyrophosphate-dependent acetolactate synthase large subunit-like protein
MVATLDRRDVVAALLADRGDLLVVTGLGSASYDVHAAGDNDLTYYLWGAMGSAALVGLGLAQACPDRRVLVITGDGEQLMGLGGLATIGIAQPANLFIVVIDNGHYGETGMQTSHTGFGLRLDDVARACLFAEAQRATTMADVARIREAIGAPAAGPRLTVIEVKAENLPRSLPPRDAVHIKNRFRAALGFATA